MTDGAALQSGVAGLTVGGLLAGIVWWMDLSLVVVAAVGIVWATAVASSLSVLASHPDSKDAGPWGAVVSGSLLFYVVLTLSDIEITTDAVTALSLLVIGFTLLGYAAGMATVHRHRSADKTATETATDTSP